MKQTNINEERLESIPYQNLFNKRMRADKWSDICIKIATFFSLLSIFIPKFWPLILLNSLIIAVGVILTWCSKIYIGPYADQERIGGFIDDAFEVKILEKPITTDYYTNGGVPKGIKRMAANCFENVFFTKNVSEKMLYKIVIKNVLFILIFMIAIVMNFRAGYFVTLFTALLQMLMGSTLLGNLLEHFYFCHAIRGIFDHFKLLYDTLSQEDENFAAQAIYMVLSYERALAYYNSQLDSKVFNELNPKLSEEWEKMKIRYRILTEEEK